MTRLSNLARALFAPSNPMGHLLSLSEAELMRRGYDRDALVKSHVLGLNH